MSKKRKAHTPADHVDPERTQAGDQPTGSQAELEQAVNGQSVGGEAESGRPAEAEPEEGRDEQQRQSPFPIVGIGASAGGLEALQGFFANMPTNCGMAFVVITHVRQGRDSLMPELLRNVTELPVVATEDETALKPNTIVVAKDSMLNIVGGVLRAAKADSQPEATYHPIDHFFRALATDQREHAIGVVLSGSGNDGTIGIKAIKAAGGMAMVQDPETAKYSSMPDSVLATQLADYILAPAAMPQALVEYCRGPYLRASHRAQKVALPEDAITAVLVRLRSHTGQDFTCYKKSTMSRRIERRMNVHHIDSPQEYVRYLRDNPRELDILQRELLISVTSFFRDPEAFEALAEKGIAPLLASLQDRRQLRIWIPGCATGEEAYSIAILLAEQMHKSEHAGDVQIFATDLDDKAIETARNGLYPEGIAAELSAERLQQFFGHEDGAYRIHKSIREMVVFAVQNVISDPPFTRLDMIVCRNVLIYLNPEAQQRVLPTFHYALRPGGLLFLGPSETLGEGHNLFEPIDAKHRILRRRQVAPPRVGQTLPIPRPHGRGESTLTGGVPTGKATSQVERAVERLLLDEFAPCVLLVDDHGTLVYARGKLGMFFQPEQGTPRNDLLAMARDGLASALAAAMRQARNENHEIIRRGISVLTNGERTLADLIVRPLSEPSQLRGMLLVIVRPAPPAAAADDNPAPKPATDDAAQKDVERDLQYTRETLQTTIEELETSNEELKSSNEELQSTNEELETSREEMQSLNEEMNTVNAELQSKINALARSNDDMNNLLNSMQVATIFLDTDMRVKRYTEQATDVVRLIETDIGRPLTDLVTSLKHPGLIDDCRRVLATLIPKEFEAEDEHGRWHLVRLMPYRTADNVIDGVVMTMIGIDRAKRAELNSNRERRFFESLVQTARQPFLVLDGNLRVALANSAFHSLFRTQPQQLHGRLIYELGERQWDVPDLRRLLEDILPRQTSFEGFRVEHEFPGIGRRTFLLNARRVESGDEPASLILLAFEDVTGKESVDGR